MKQRSYNIRVHDVGTVRGDGSHAPGKKDKFKQVVHGQPDEKDLQNNFKNINNAVDNPVHQPMFF